MKKILIIWAAVAMAFVASASVSVDLDLMTLNDASGVPISEGIKFLVFIDKDNNGINGADLSNYFDYNAMWNSVVNTESFLWDLNDEIIYNGSSAGWGSSGYFSMADANGGYAMINLGNGINQGDRVYAMWFPELAGNAVKPGNISQVGFLTGNDWVLPADTGLMQINQYDFNQSAINVIPEPATALLALIGGGLAWASRRAKRFHNYES